MLRTQLDLQLMAWTKCLPCYDCPFWGSLMLMRWIAGRRPEGKGVHAFPVYGNAALPQILRFIFVMDFMNSPSNVVDADGLVESRVWWRRKQELVSFDVLCEMQPLDEVGVLPLASFDFTSDFMLMGSTAGEWEGSGEAQPHAICWGF